MGRPKKRKPLGKALTPMQRKFLDEMLLDPTGNAANAAKRAGYSPDSARYIARDLKKNPIIKEALETANQKVAWNLGITRERLIQELARLAFANIKDVVSQDEEGNIDINLATVPDDAAAAVTGISVGKKGSVKEVKVTLADKRQALLDLAKMFDWTREKVEVNATLSLEQLIQKSMEPPKTISQPTPTLIEGAV